MIKYVLISNNSIAYRKTKENKGILWAEWSGHKMYNNDQTFF